MESRDCDLASLGKLFKERFAALPSTTQHNERDVKKSNFVTSTGRRTELGSCYAISLNKFHDMHDSAVDGQAENTSQLDGNSDSDEGQGLSQEYNEVASAGNGGDTDADADANDDDHDDDDHDCKDSDDGEDCNDDGNYDGNSYGDDVGNDNKLEAAPQDPKQPRKKRHTKRKRHPRGAKKMVDVHKRAREGNHFQARLKDSLGKEVYKKRRQELRDTLVKGEKSLRQKTAEKEVDHFALHFNDARKDNAKIMKSGVLYTPTAQGRVAFKCVRNKNGHRKELITELVHRQQDPTVIAKLNFTKLKELLQRLEGDKVSFSQQSIQANFLYGNDKTSSSESDRSDHDDVDSNISE